MLADFLVFTLLARRRGVVPSQGWDWSEYLDVASGLLPYAFEKSDAREKYGRENVFSGFIVGGRSLRATGIVVYGFGSDPCSSDEGHDELVEQVDALPFPRLLAGSPALFGEVGGAAAWRTLRAALVRFLPPLIS